MKRKFMLVLAAVMLLTMSPPGILAADQAAGTYSWENLKIADIPEIAPEEDPLNGNEITATDHSFYAGVNAAYTPLTGFSQVKPREPAAGEKIRYGIDVSSWQGKIDWAAVAADGVEFAIIRVAARGYGTGELMQDNWYQDNIKNARANGIKVGAYIFSQATTVAEGVEEARFLMNLLEGYTVDLPLAIDYEFSPKLSNGSPGKLQAANLSRQEGTDVCNAFCAEVEKYGYSSMTYANASMLNNHLCREQLGRVWLAHYVDQSSPSTSYAGDYEYWQFTSSGAISGISGRVDMNIWFDRTLPFTDVPAWEWYYNDVVWAYENEIIYGKTANLFGPDDDVERGQMAAMLYRMAGSPGAAGPAPFTDLTEDYYRDAVAWAYQNEIVFGTSETEELFSPGLSVERQELVAMLYRKLGEPETGLGQLAPFRDTWTVANWAKYAMAWAVETGIIKGYSENATLRPENPASRAEIVAILRRFQQVEQEKELADKTAEIQEKINEASAFAWGWFLDNSHTDKENPGPVYAGDLCYERVIADGISDLEGLKKLTRQYFSVDVTEDFCRLKSWLEQDDGLYVSPAVERTFDEIEHYEIEVSRENDEIYTVLLTTVYRDRDATTETLHYLKQGDDWVFDYPFACAEEVPVKIKA